MTTINNAVNQPTFQAVQPKKEEQPKETKKGIGTTTKVVVGTGLAALAAVGIYIATKGKGGKAVEKQVEKAAEKQVAKAAEKQAEKAAEKQAAKAGEKQAEKAAEKQVAKAAEKQAEKAAEKQAAKAGEKQAEKAAEKQATEVAENIVEKAPKKKITETSLSPELFNGVKAYKLPKEAKIYRNGANAGDFVYSYKNKEGMEVFDFVNEYIFAGPKGETKSYLSQRMVRKPGSPEGTFQKVEVFNAQGEKIRELINKGNDVISYKDFRDPIPPQDGSYFSWQGYYERL